MAREANQAVERRVVHYAGRVQGVGFRFTVRSLAERIGICGTVENLPDGRVRLVAEDTPEKLERLQAAVAAEMDPYIRSIDVERFAARGDLTDFHILR